MARRKSLSNGLDDLPRESIKSVGFDALGAGGTEKPSDDSITNQESKDEFDRNEKVLETKRQKRKRKEPFKKTLETILCLRASKKLVPEAVFLSSLGEDISYQEAILLSLVIKAANGDLQSANFIREASGNKQKDENEKPKCPKFEDL